MESQTQKLFIFLIRIIIGLIMLIYYFLPIEISFIAKDLSIRIVNSR
jgi:hypothetical protein